MKLTEQEQKTIDYYNQNSQKWAAKHGVGEDQDFFVAKRTQFLKLAPKGKILEIGCGSGREAEAIILDRGAANYVGIDASSELIKLARTNNPTGTFVNTSVYDLTFPQNTFSGIFASAVFIHLPKARVAEALAEITKTLTPDAVGYISLLEGEGDMVESRPGRFYTLYTDPEFLRILEENNFELLEKDRLDRPDQSPWLTYIFKLK